MNINEILKHAPELSLEDLLSGVNDDAINVITCNVLRLTSACIADQRERIEALKTVQASLNESNLRLLSQRDEVHKKLDATQADLVISRETVTRLRDDRNTLRQYYDKLVDDEYSARSNLTAAKSTIATLRLEYTTLGADRVERIQRARDLAEQLADKDAMLERANRDCDTLRSEYDKTVKRADEQFERSRAIGNRLARNLEGDPQTATWLSVLSIGHLADVDCFIIDHQKLSVIKLVREATSCGLKEAKDAVDARIAWLDRQKEIEKQAAAGFMETSEALDLLHALAENAVRDIEDTTINARMQLALDTVHDFITNQFPED